MKGQLKIFTIISIIFLYITQSAGGFPMPAQTDWDKVLDRYEALCNQCIDLKLRAESGEKVSGAEFSRLIGNLNNLRKLLREDSGSMSPAQRSRFSRIRDRYSNVFGKGSRTKVRVNADEASVSGSGEVSHAENRTGKQAQAGYGPAGSHGENSKYAGERSDSGYSAVNQGVNDDTGERGVLHGTGGVQLGTTGYQHGVTGALQGVTGSHGVSAGSTLYIPETLSTSGLTAEAFSFGTMDIIQRDKGIDPNPKREPRRIAVGAAGMVAAAPEFLYGGMVSVVFRKTDWGAYAKYLSDYQSNSSSYNCTSDGKFSGGKMWLSGNTRTSSYMFSAGARKVIWKGLGAFAGVGYGEHSVYWEDVSGNWAKVTDSSVNGAIIEAGVSYTLKPVEFFVGISTISFGYNSLECGIGLRF